MKFNLKRHAEKAQEGDIHTEKKLEQDRVPEKEEITQQQLEKDRIPEKEVLTEKLLEKNRTGGADKILEKSLNESKSKLHNHRNSEAYMGDINKVEEQRVSKAKNEDEKYELASGTPKKKQWWDKLKAEASKKVVTAQYWGSDDPDELNFDEGKSWDRVEEEDFGGGAREEDFGGDDFPIDDMDLDDFGDDEITENPFQDLVMEDTDIGGVVLGSVRIDLDLAEMVSAMSDEEIKQRVRDMVIESNPEVNIEEDGIDLDKLSSGVVNFVGQKQVPDFEEDDFGLGGESIEPSFASKDFDIVVLSQSSDIKKN